MSASEESPGIAQEAARLVASRIHSRETHQPLRRLPAPRARRRVVLGLWEQETTTAAQRVAGEHKSVVARASLPAAQRVLPGRHHHVPCVALQVGRSRRRRRRGEACFCPSLGVACGRSLGLLCRPFDAHVEVTLVRLAGRGKQPRPAWPVHGTHGGANLFCASDVAATVRAARGSGLPDHAFNGHVHLLQLDVEYEVTIRPVVGTASPSNVVWRRDQSTLVQPLAGHKPLQHAPAHRPRGSASGGHAWQRERLGEEGDNVPPWTTLSSSATPPRQCHVCLA